MNKQASVVLIGLAIAGMAAGAAQAEPARGGTIKVATIGEPPTLDPMTSTADLVGIITQHIYETLYTFDANWQVTPLVAEALPEIADGGKSLTIRIRDGLTFHDGTDLTASDVVASLNRWMEMASRGKLAAGHVTGIEAVDDLTVRITLSAPFAPLPSLLALNNSAAVIMPEEKVAGPLDHPVGSGPYMLKERAPDRYIQLVRFDGYKPREGEPDGYGGARHAYLDEIDFIPVPNANTRVEGAIAGQYDYADALPVESFDRIQGGESEALLLEPFGWPVMVMNMREGLLADPDLRKAVQAALNPEDMMAAAFGSTDFYAADGALYPEGFIWHTEAGVEAYNQNDQEAAAALVEKAGYDGRTPLRILTSRQYEFHYKMGLVAAEYLKLAGFKVDLQVSDWATLTQRRNEPGLWEIYITHSPFLPEPSLTGSYADNAPGWWDTPRKREVLEAFNTETDPDRRIALFAEVQQAVFDEVPFYKVGNFNGLSAKAPRLQGFQPTAWPHFWNAWVEN